MASSRPAPGSVGTLAWLDATDGVLRPGDRLRLLGQGLRFEGVETTRMLAGRLGLRLGRIPAVDLDEVRVPDSAAARAADELVSEARPASLVAHSYRTFLWASVLGKAERLGYDEEAVYVASLLHDLGLADGAHDGRGCFTRVGADAARKAASAGGWSAERADLAAEAVSMHLNLRVPRSSTEANLVARGTALDVVGAEFFTLPPATAADVAARYPRGTLKDDLVRIFRQQARQCPGTRSHFYTRYLGLTVRFRLAPFPS